MYLPLCCCCHRRSLAGVFATAQASTVPCAWLELHSAAHSPKPPQPERKVICEFLVRFALLEEAIIEHVVLWMRRDGEKPATARVPDAYACHQACGYDGGMGRDRLLLFFFSIFFLNFSSIVSL